MKHLKQLNVKTIICILLILVITLTGTVFVSDKVKMSSPIGIGETLSGSKNYEDKEEGAWKLDKTAKWIDFHKAQITFNFDSIIKNNGRYQDILFVIDVSGSMAGEKIDKVKSDATELTNLVLKDSNNRVGIITFDTASEILVELTNNKTQVLDAIDGLTNKENTNYYQALVNVEKILKSYKKENNRDFIVLFLTDGYANEETPNENGQYILLKEKYPFIDIVGIQYEMGQDILDPIIKVSDSQQIADMENLNNVLLEATSTVEYFNKIEIADYINNDNFYIESVDDIHPSVGTVELIEENGKQKVIWTIGDGELRTGFGATLTIDVTLKEEAYDDEYVTTNEKEEITVQIRGEDEEKEQTTIKPRLQNKYEVTYDENSPSDCIASNIPEKKSYYAFEKVTIEDGATCKGYNFKEWKISTEGVEKANKKLFIMPDKDVNLKAKWGKVNISKSLNGKIYSDVNFTNYILSKANDVYVKSYEAGEKKEMYTFTHPETKQTGPLTDYRYIGNEPNNYVYFNCKKENVISTCEKWRIIGVFNVDNGTGRFEKRVKLMKDYSFYYSWNSNNSNDWSVAKGKTYLNGTFYNTLGASSRLMIGEARYYLGGSDTNAGHSGPTYYDFERGTEVNTTSRPINWTGKIALMYPSDYAYTYALGVDDTCYSDTFNCKDGNPTNGWIYNSNLNKDGYNPVQWLLSPRSSFGYRAYCIIRNGTINSGDYGVSSSAYAFRPVLYLTPDVFLLSGDGSFDAPYLIGRI